MEAGSGRVGMIQRSGRIRREKKASNSSREGCGMKEKRPQVRHATKGANEAQRLTPESTKNSPTGNALRAKALACASMDSTLVSATLNERKAGHETY